MDLCRASGDRARRSADSFAPLAGLEVQSTRAEGDTLVVNARISINLQALTIEQVVSKRRSLLCEMVENTMIDLRDALRKHPVPPRGRQA